MKFMYNKIKILKIYNNYYINKDKINYLKKYIIQFKQFNKKFEKFNL